jgi:hypothetical protein
MLNPVRTAGILTNLSVSAFWENNDNFFPRTDIQTIKTKSDSGKQVLYFYRNRFYVFNLHKNFDLKIYKNCKKIEIFPIKMIQFYRNKTS